MKGVVKTAIEYDEDGIEIQFLNSMRCQVVKVRPGCCHETLRSQSDFGVSQRRKFDIYSGKSCRLA